MKFKAKYVIALLLPSLLLLSVACNLFWQQSETPDPLITPTMAVKSTTISTLPPPLQNVPFPEQPIILPTDWPSDLIYPKKFIVVEASSGTSPVEEALGWSTKLRYAGKPQDAANDLGKHFQLNGWSILETHQLDTGGIVLVIQKDENGNGVIVFDLDPSDPNNTIIASIILP